MMKPTSSAADWRHRLIRPAAEIAAKGFIRFHISADALTVTGFTIVGMAAGLIVSRHLVWAGVALLIGSLLDSVDGAIARLMGRTSRFGAMLDSVLDRLSEGAVLVALIYVSALDNNAPVSALAGVALLFSFIVSYVRARAEGLGISCSEGWFTRVERVIVLTLGLLTGYVVVALALVAVFSLVTLIQRLYAVWGKAR